MPKVTNFQIIAVVVVVLVIVLAATFTGEDDGNGKKGTSGGWDTPYDNHFGNVKVTVQGLHSDSNTNEPYIAINPNDPMNIVAAGNDYSTLLGDVWLGYYYSFDGGASWNRSFLPGYPGDIRGDLSPLFGFMGAGDAVVAFGPDGECYISLIAFERPVGEIRNGIYVARSNDGGKTFDGSDIHMVVDFGDGFLAFHDKEWIAVDPNSGDVYVTWSWFTAYSTAQILYSRSTDGGETWSDYQVLSQTLDAEIGNQGSQVVVDSEGVVHVIWVDFDREVIRYTSSGDGSSFSTPVDLVDIDPIPYALNNNTYRTPTLPSLAVDTSGTDSDGNLYITWNDFRSGDADALLIMSDDGGDSWTDPVRVNQDEFQNGADQFFPAASVTPEGVVGIAFYDRREDTHNTMLNMYMATSTDQGATFQDFKITTEDFDGEAGGGSALGQATSGDAFIGDYIGTVANDEYIYAIWCDTRNGDPDDRDADLYTARAVIDRI